jgi:hypothetical protein
MLGLSADSGVGLERDFRGLWAKPDRGHERARRIRIIPLPNISLSTLSGSLVITG